MFKRFGSALIIFILVISITNICFSWQINMVKKIPLNGDNKPLLLTGSFAAMEDGYFILTDIKDKDYQLKLFDGTGKLLKAWGKMGLGPDEFGGAAFLDYQSPYLAVQDVGKRCIHVFSNPGNFELQKVSDVLAWEANRDIKLYGKNIIIPGYIVSPKGKEYVLFMRDLSGKKTEYLLPLENEYGANSLGGHKQIHDEVSGVSYAGFMAVSENTIFYVSDVRLRIAKIDARTRKIDFIGNEPKNFRPLAMNNKTKNDLLQPGNKVMENILTDHSFVSGIFADKDIVGVIYVNREKKLNNELYFVPYVQVYDHFGKLLCEQVLAPAYSEERILPIFYQPDKRHLYLLPTISNKTTYDYTIYDFSLQP